MLTATLSLKTVHCDSGLVTCTELFDLEIVFSVRPEEDDECDEEDAIAEPSSNHATLAGAVGCLGMLRDLVSQQQAVAEEVHKNIYYLDSFVTSCALKAAVQMKIADLFQSEIGSNVAP